MKGMRRGLLVALFTTLSSSLLGAPPTDTKGPSSPAPGEWRLIGGNQYEQHYSELTRINDKNVGNLKLAWYADMPTDDGLTGVPIVADGVVYQSGALGKAWANDLRTGKQLWSFDAGIKFPLGVIPAWGARLSRGLAIWEDKVLKATGDCRLFALDRKTGHTLWEAQSCDPAAHKTITGAPRVGDGKVFIGNSNADSGIGRGYVDAYDINTGKRLWRFYTIPGDPAKGFENKAMEMASKTWGKEYWKNTGGGSTWEGITYDPRTRLVYIGTDGPSPFDPSLRGEGRGDELFTNAIVAVNVDTGEYVWHYSTTPGDGWNYAATMPVVLADLMIGGQKRAVLMTAPKNGFFYVLDARTGKLANQPQNIVAANWASRIDLATGRPVQLPDAQYWLARGKNVFVTPSPMGAHNWMPMSYSTLTGLVYIPVTDYPVTITSNPHNLVGSTEIDFYYGLNHKGTFKGSLLAWDPVKQQKRWQHDIGMPYQGGTLATAGNLVFQGTTEAQFNAYRADTGEKLWSMPTVSGILGAPSTVEIDREQMILVAAGSGTTSSVIFAPQFSGGAVGPSRLLAFSLSGSAKLPTSDVRPANFPQPAQAEPAAALADQGKQIWDTNGCELCHGFRVIGGLSTVPDLRRVSSLPLDLFGKIVREGLLKDGGMPVFGDVISAKELPALEAYITQSAWKAYRDQQASRVGR
jgi:PQQ-dependent dehydrogenase (methanol/ethanol family)